MGWAFVKRRMVAELGPDWQNEIRELRASAGGGRLARPGASRPRARRRRAGLQAAISRHAVGGRGRPAAAAAALRHPPPHGPGDRHHRDRQGDRRAHARGARLPARGQARRALPRDARRRRRRSACRGSWPELSTGRLLTLDWLEGRRLLEHKDDDLADPQPPRHRDVHGLVVAVQPLRRHPRRSASRQLHGVRARTARPAGINLLDYGCIRIFPPKFVGGVVDLYHGLLQRRRRPHRARLRDLGLQAAQPRADRRAQYLGALHLRAAARGPRAQPSPTASSPPNTAAARRSGCTRRSSRRGRSRCRASSCSWTAPRSGSAACSCICAPSSISTGCSTRRSSDFSIDARRASGRPQALGRRGGSAHRLTGRQSER